MRGDNPTKFKLRGSRRSFKSPYWKPPMPPPSNLKTEWHSLFQAIIALLAIALFIMALAFIIKSVLEPRPWAPPATQPDAITFMIEEHDLACQRHASPTNSAAASPTPSVPPSSPASSAATGRNPPSFASLVATTTSWVSGLMPPVFTRSCHHLISLIRLLIWLLKPN